MLREHWMTVNEFMEKHDLKSRSNVHMAPDKKQMMMKSKSNLWINENYALRRHAFRESLWHQAHKNFFVLTEGKSEMDLARLLARITNEPAQNWRSFMYSYLFSRVDNRSILDYKCSQKLWDFWRYTSWVIKIDKRKRCEKEARLGIKNARWERRDRVKKAIHNFKYWRVVSTVL